MLARCLGGATPISSLVVIRHGNIGGLEVGVTGPGHTWGLVVGVPTQVSHTLSVSLVSLASPVSNAGRGERSQVYHTLSVSLVSIAWRGERREFVQAVGVLKNWEDSLSVKYV